MSYLVPKILNYTIIVSVNNTSWIMDKTVTCIVVKHGKLIITTIRVIIITITIIIAIQFTN